MDEEPAGRNQRLEAWPETKQVRLPGSWWWRLVGGRRLAVTELGGGQTGSATGDQTGNLLEISYVRVKKLAKTGC